MKQGAEVLELAGSVLSIGGAIDVCRSHNAVIEPLLWCFATPAGIVQRSAFERILGDLCRRLADAAPVDGVFLELHGAMVTEDFEDGDGEILSRVRDMVGRDVPLAVSLDLHANVTGSMLELADYLDAYRRYPHVDMAETGARTAERLIHMVSSGMRPAKSLRKPDFLIPMNASCTGVEPGSRLYRTVLASVETGRPGLFGCSFASGFPFSDIHEVGPAAFAYAETQDAADAAAKELAGWVEAHENEFMPEVFSSRDAVAYAQRLALKEEQPVILVDTQDNPGCGGPGDTTGLLRALVGAMASGAVLATLIDAEASDEAAKLGVGGQGSFRLGGKTPASGESFATPAKVLALAEGPFRATGPMFKGLEFDFGKMALLATPQGVRIITGSRPVQTADQSVFRRVGVEPATVPIIALKSSVHFRADFAPIASRILLVDAPGIAPVDVSQLKFRAVRSGLRLTPAARA